MSENLNITNREDIFLGKIAGMDVDISTMTPPVANGTHEQILDKIADRIDGMAENSLPEIETTDEGKVLGVADGKYALVSGGGGGSVEPLIVTIGDNGIDATYNEIKSAVLAGRAIYALSEQDSETEHTAFYSVLTEFSAQEYDGVASYSAIFQNNSFMASDPDVDMAFSE